MDYGKYVSSLPDDPIDAMSELVSGFEKLHAENLNSSANNWHNLRTTDYQMFFQLAWKFIEKFDLKFEADTIASTNTEIVSFYKRLNDNVIAWLANQIFEKKYMPNTDALIFDPVKNNNLQEKTNELRQLVIKADFLMPKHRDRLFARLEKFQRELNKPIANRDAFLAGWADVNELIEDMGMKSKPLVDRFREIISSATGRDTALITAEDKPKQIEDHSDGTAE